MSKEEMIRARKERSKGYFVLNKTLDAGKYEVKSANTYEIELTRQKVSCSCPDYKYRCFRYNMCCKHLMFALAKLTKLPLTDPQYSSNVLTKKAKQVLFPQYPWEKVKHMSKTHSSKRKRLEKEGEQQKKPKFIMAVVKKRSV